MRFFIPIICLVFLASCEDERQGQNYTKVKIEIVYQDSLSIRAIELLNGSLAFAADKGVFGSVDLRTQQVRTNVQQYDSILPHFRAVGHTSQDFFMLSIANPALLYKTGERGKMELVYEERDSLVFYDAMAFWNDREGIAIGDAMNGCLSMIITRDGGNSWSKLDCTALPAALKGEGAFAASNTNIAIIENLSWVATTESRIFFSPDKGKTWRVWQTPLVKEQPAEGIYSIDFWDEQLGFAFGGDYTRPEENSQNKAITFDGGKSWQLVAESSDPGYKSCVQFVPGSGGRGLVAIGFTGISYSHDQGTSWKNLSTESFYTLRFLNDSVAYAAGRNRIAKLTFK